MHRLSPKEMERHRLNARSRNFIPDLKKEHHHSVDLADLELFELLGRPDLEATVENLHPPPPACCFPGFKESERNPQRSQLSSNNQRSRCSHKKVNIMFQNPDFKPTSGSSQYESPKTLPICSHMKVNTMFINANFITKSESSSHKSSSACSNDSHNKVNVMFTNRNFKAESRSSSQDSTIALLNGQSNSYQNKPTTAGKNRKDKGMSLSSLKETLNQDLRKFTSDVEEHYPDLPSLNLSSSSKDRRHARLKKEIEQIRAKMFTPTNWDKLLKDKSPPADTAPPLGDPHKKSMTDLEEEIAKTVLTPIIVKIQDTLAKNRLEYLALMQELKELPDLLAKTIRRSVKSSKANKIDKRNN